MLTDLIPDTALNVGLPAVKRALGVVTRVLPIPQPTLMVGPGSSIRLGETISGLGHRRIFVVTDGVITRLGLATPLLEALTRGGSAFVVFDEITPDAPIPLVEKGIEMYRRESCDAIVAFGGGSVMDSAKAIGVSVANDKHPRELVGYFKGWSAPPPIYAVPTTAGTGSEVTVAAVISDPENHTKLVIADTRMVPRLAALDPCLMTGLPGPITAATGMDALTHAIEAYIGQWGTDFTDRMALAAVAMIYENLPIAYTNGQDLGAREKMALASTYAGLAFTRANVGNVHAIAHQLGGLYHTPHGLANAIVLPPVLRFSSPFVHRQARRPGGAGRRGRERPAGGRAGTDVPGLRRGPERLAGDPGSPRHAPRGGHPGTREGRLLGSGHELPGPGPDVPDRVRAAAPPDPAGAWRSGTASAARKQGQGAAPEEARTPAARRRIGFSRAFRRRNAKPRVPVLSACARRAPRLRAP